MITFYSNKFWISNSMINNNIIIISYNDHIILMILMIMIIFIIPILMLILNLYLMFNNKIMREKHSSFECGFQPMSISRLPFSIQFFFITIIFLIFDIEMSLLFPMIKNLNLINLSNWLISSITIFIILLMGLFIEWLNNLIKWFY